jgi:Chaperonin 10 Kd subunit.
MTRKALPTFTGKAVFELDPPSPPTFYLVVRPKPPKKQTDGGLLLAKRTQNAELATRTVGQVVAMGALAFKAGTPDMDPTKDPVAQSVKVGTWVQYRQHGGQKLKIRKDFDKEAADVDEQLDEHLITIADTDVIGVFRDEAHAERFYDWV